MSFIEKVNRRLKRIYYDRKIGVKQRVNFNSKIYYDSINDEVNVGCFERPIFLLSYDDTSMMGKSRHTFDYGGDLDGQLNRLFFDFLEKYPYLRHTLFFVPNPNFTNDGLTSRTIKNDIYDIGKYSPEETFLAKLSDLEKSGVIEISLHGYNHLNTKIKDYYSPFEFEFLTNREAKEKITRGLSDLGKYFELKGFKPPAWGMGQLSGSHYLVNILQEYEFNYVCLSSPSNGLNFEGKCVNYIYPTNINSLFNIPQNISILWDLDYIYSLIDLIVKKRGIINIQLHYTLSRPSLTDGLSHENLAKLSKIVEYIKNYDVDYLLHNEVRSKCKK